MPTSLPGEFTPQQACPGWLQGNRSLRWSCIVCKSARGITLPVLPSVALCLSPIPFAIIKCAQHRSAGIVHRVLRATAGLLLLNPEDRQESWCHDTATQAPKMTKNGVKAGTKHCLPKSSCCFNKKEPRPNLFSFFILLWHSRDESSSWILNYPVKIVRILLFHPRGRTASSFLSILMVFITKTEEELPHRRTYGLGVRMSQTHRLPSDGAGTSWFWPETPSCTLSSLDEHLACTQEKILFQLTNIYLLYKKPLLKNFPPTFSFYFFQ